MKRYVREKATGKIYEDVHSSVVKRWLSGEVDVVFDYKLKKKLLDSNVVEFDVDRVMTESGKYDCEVIYFADDFISDGKQDTINFYLALRLRLKGIVKSIVSAPGRLEELADEIINSAGNEIDRIMSKNIEANIIAKRRIDSERFLFILTNDNRVLCIEESDETKSAAMLNYLADQFLLFLDSETKKAYIGTIKDRFFKDENFVNKPWPKLNPQNIKYKKLFEEIPCTSDEGERNIRACDIRRMYIRGEIELPDNEPEWLSEVFYSKDIFQEKFSNMRKNNIESRKAEEEKAELEAFKLEEYRQREAGEINEPYFAQLDSQEVLSLVVTSANSGATSENIIKYLMIPVCGDIVEAKFIQNEEYMTYGEVICSAYRHLPIDESNVLDFRSLMFMRVYLKGISSDMTLAEKTKIFYEVLVGLMQSLWAKHKSLLGGLLGPEIFETESAGNNDDAGNVTGVLQFDMSVPEHLKLSKEDWRLFRRGFGMQQMCICKRPLRHTDVMCSQDIKYTCSCICWSCETPIPVKGDTNKTTKNFIDFCSFRVLRDAIVRDFSGIFPDSATWMVGLIFPRDEYIKYHQSVPDMRLVDIARSSLGYFPPIEFLIPEYTADPLIFTANYNAVLSICFRLVVENIGPKVLAMGFTRPKEKLLEDKLQRKEVQISMLEEKIKVLQNDVQEVISQTKKQCSDILNKHNIRYSATALEVMLPDSIRALTKVVLKRPQKRNIVDISGGTEGSESGSKRQSLPRDAKNK